MTPEDSKLLKQDPDGLITYEYLANHIDTCDADLADLVDNLVRVDLSGQFLASTARYLNAIDPDKYADTVRHLVAATIDKDREHRYLPGILSALYGDNYADRAAELSTTDDNFRRIYKRLFPNPESL
ncbi:MAG: hypothetical protein Q4C34_03300 [Bacteroidales bacterium]|nr:hypothetical protein [Bacteroidales bacterium]